MGSQAGSPYQLSMFDQGAMDYLRSLKNFEEVPESHKIKWFVGGLDRRVGTCVGNLYWEKGDPEPIRSMGYTVVLLIGEDAWEFHPFQLFPVIEKESDGKQQ